MSLDPAQVQQGLATVIEIRCADVYRLLLAFAEEGHAEAQGVIGSFVSLVMHRFNSLDEFQASAASITLEQAAADREEGGKWLTAASDAGVGPASFNLAGLYFSGYGGGSWEERRAKAAELYAKAYRQGFTAFAHITGGGSDTPGEPYLSLMEGYARTRDIPMPGCPKPEAESPGQEPS